MSPERDSFAARWSIWLFAFGYFAAYVPYSILSKLATSSAKEGGWAVHSLGIQAVMTVGSVFTAYAFITAMGWWKYATRGWAGLPRPQWFTLVSGLCASIQIITTTLAYTFHGVTIALVMLFLRGGVLVIAPVVDLVHKKRHVHITSWIASAVSLLALVITVWDSFGKGNGLPGLLILNIFAYLTVYFFRLLFMSGRAKSVDPDLNKRFFVEEQMVAAPGLLVLLVIFALVGHQLGPKNVLYNVWAGFRYVPKLPVAPWLLLAGALSTGTGIFGTLIFLDKRETTFTVPVNRASSILAGLIATAYLHWQYAQKEITTLDYIGAALIILAILVLMMRPKAA